MIIPTSINFIMFSIIIVVLFFLNFRLQQRYFLFFIGFIIPLITPGFNIGINIFLFNIVGPISIFLLFLVKKRRKSFHRDKYLIRFIFYVLFVTSFWMIFEYLFLQRYLTVDAALGLGQSYFKMPVQLLSFVSQLVAFYIIPKRASSSSDIYSAFWGYFFGNIFSFAVGVLLIALTGQGMIGRKGIGITPIIGSQVARIGGLSGEPKMFGAFLVIMLALFLSLIVFECTKKKSYYIAFASGSLAIFLTYSTSAWSAFAAVLVIFSVIFIKHVKKARSKIIMYIIPIVILLASSSTFVLSVVESRYTKKISPEELRIQKDRLVLDVYKNEPHNILFGYGMGGFDLAAQPYYNTLPQYSRHHAYVRTPTPALNGMKLSGDLGIVGFLFLSFIVRRWHKSLVRSGEVALGVFVLIGFVGLMLSSINAISAYFFLSGGALTLARIRSNEIRNRKVIN